jgi:hypothetical protein
MFAKLKFFGPNDRKQKVSDQGDGDKSDNGILHVGLNG